MRVKTGDVVPIIGQRTIKPIKPKAERLQIIAATEYDGGTREDGTAIDWLDLPEIIKNERGIIATNCGATLLQFLECFHKSDPLWQVRVTIRENTVARFDDRVRVRKPIIGFLGFMAPKVKGARRKSHYWQVLDPTVFLDDPKAGMTLTELMTWALDVREWCNDNGIRIKATAGGLSAQLLRHPRFYPEPRRRIPGATNDKARDALPGNHYELRSDTSSQYCADYIDQASAHHSAAMSVSLPDSNLYALGFYKDLSKKRWATLEDLPENALGLLYAKVWIPGRKSYKSNWGKNESNEEFRPEWAKESGYHYVYIFTSELEYLTNMGGYIVHISAAWLSCGVDTGLQEYARWSIGEISRASLDRREWLKKTLLTTYGLLATKPSHFEVGWRQSKGGEIRPYPIGADLIDFKVRRTSKPIHPTIAHVIQRGMIEAETRLRSIQLANDLLADGEHVLCIYGDGLLVRTLPWRTEQRELLPAPWRIKERVTRLRFINEQSFQSEQITRLPGIPAAHRSKKDLGKVLT